MASRERCGDCLYWDHRAETEMDEHTGYCTIHEMMKRDDQSCPQFHRRTPESEARYYQQLYNDGTEYGPGDLDLSDL